MTRRKIFFGWCACLVAITLGISVAHADRVKDLASVAGVRRNQLVGYGLVVGLDGTGDQTSQAPFTVQSLKNMLQRFGVTVPDNVRPQLRNAAAVTVTATLPPFAKPGQTIDVTVSSIGNAKSLRGGTLLMTPLKGANGKTYAIAQGNLIVGGLSASGADGSSITVNIPSAGRIPNGATVEKKVPSNFAERAALLLNLNRPDFTTATRLAQTINKKFGAHTAVPMDADSVRVRAPKARGQRVAFVSVLNQLKVKPAAPPARVIVNSRTGTVVIGSNVHVSPAAVSHGSLEVTIAERPVVSQPGPFSNGQTAVVPRSRIRVKQNGGHMFLFNPGVSLNAIVRAVNQVGAAPSDLVAILEALEKAGALRAQLIVI
jgi:flagellar P-ring protein precursor FlgI